MIKFQSHRITKTLKCTSIKVFIDFVAFHRSISKMVKLCGRNKKTECFCPEFKAENQSTSMVLDRHFLSLFIYLFIHYKFILEF